MSQLDILLVLLRVAFGAFVPLCFIAVLVWLERRGAAFFQDRAGPNRAHIFGFRAAGLVQNAADGIKLIFKEDVIPGHSSHKGIPMDLGILWFLAITGFAVYGIILAGWSSHNKYGVLGALRASAQVISYEIPMGLALVSLLVVYGTINLNEIVHFQGKLLFGFIPMWGVVLQPLAAVIFIVSAFAETNRTPFDLAEGESELVAGFHVEYSAMKFALFFMGEYVAMFVSSSIIITLFFGGYQIPWLTTETLVAYAKPITYLLVAGIPVAAGLFCGWMMKNNKSHYDRPNDPRVREAKVYRVIIWMMVVVVEAVLIGYLLYAAGGGADRILVVLLQIATFLVKTFMMCFVYVWVRWTLPRFRYDQLQLLGWKMLLPLALLNIFITSAVVVALS